MNSFRNFVAPDAKTQNVKKLVDHVDYITNLIGIEHIACGFLTVADSPGIDGLKTTSETPNVIRELKNRGYKDCDIEL